MELFHIGQNCMVCNRNDYLPFKCAKCDKIVCIDHRSDHGTECPMNKSEFIYNQNDSKSESLRQACDHCRKITLKLELTECMHCSQNHCLYHRHQVQHNCPKLDEDKRQRELEAEARVARQQEALEKLKQTQKTIPSSIEQKTPIIQQVPEDPKKLALARRVRIMKIRQSARGPPNVLDKDKLYFEVKFLHEPKCAYSSGSRHGKVVNIFATTKHSVGRLIDWAADELDVTNKNHIVDCDQLIFRTTTSKNLELDNQLTFQAYIDSNELDSGDQLQLTYKLLSSNSNSKTS